MSEKTLALAGIFQATELVRQAANHGTWSGYAASTCIESLLCLHSEQVEEIYGGINKVHLGLETLNSVLQGENRHLDALRYAVGILQIERKFRKNRSMQATVGESLQEISVAYQDYEQHDREDQQAADLANIYAETISTLHPRIVVNGKPQYLQAERTVNWIRTLLFSGLRSAVLWNQLGGGRWNLMFGRKQMLKDTQNLLRS